MGNASYVDGIGGVTEKEGVVNLEIGKIIEIPSIRGGKEKAPIEVLFLILV